MKKIMFLSHTAKLGGAERSLLDILKYIDKDKFQPYFVCFEEGPLTKAASEIKGVEVNIIPFSKKIISFNRDTNSLFQLIYALLLIKPLLKLIMLAHLKKIDIIYSNSMKAHFIGVLLGKITNKPVIWHVRDILEEGLYKKLFRLFSKFTRKIICISKAVSEQFSHPDIEIVYNGLSTTMNRSKHEIIEKKKMTILLE